jgi:hypothetical protein
MQSDSTIRQRLASEWKRSFVLGLFTFIWFFVVPMPGLLVFKAFGGYRIWMSPENLVEVAMIAFGVVVAAGGASLLLERWENHGLAGNGLLARIKQGYQAFQLMASQAGRLSPVQVSEFYAMFTDIQTYLDQRSYAYAWRTLRRFEEAFAVVSESEERTEGKEKG